MKIEVSRLPRDGVWLEEEEPAALLDLETDPHARAAGPIRCRIFAQAAGQELIVKGDLAAPVRLCCAWCGEFFSTTVRVSSFLRAFPLTDAAETVDVSNDIREDVLLGIPDYPSCSPDCKGLCPRCGRNLNHGECTCPAEPERGRGWAWGELRLP